MPKVIYEDGDPVGRMEISGKDREEIAAIAARLALRWAVIVTAVMTTVIFVQRLMDRPLND